MKRLILFATLAVSLYGAKKEPKWEYGKVLAQDTGADRSGAYVGPVGTGAIAVPLYRRYNFVRIESGGYIYGWSEVGRRVIVLPVGQEVQFYRDGDWFVVLDIKHRKHKFALTSQEVTR